jgi:hypothetical protein
MKIFICAKDGNPYTKVPDREVRRAKKEMPGFNDGLQKLI